MTDQQPVNRAHDGTGRTTVDEAGHLLGVGGA
ncbi:hypothetical protein HNR22_003271 [Micromonospora jinlongensis]|uniref:Uncharacterized protein n=1 Tax=Micromonospora jinlongensis TaxID=1287877 RepID=A0A7Z0BFX1_9ACTN|nr:hypothetical protein [Micromonospora jinlongensis]